jgi:hypothetical protein
MLIKKPLVPEGPSTYFRRNAVSFLIARLVVLQDSETGSIPLFKSKRTYIYQEAIQTDFLTLLRVTCNMT